MIGIESQLDNLIQRFVDRSQMLREPKVHNCREQIQECGNSFLRLEKYVNLNFIGFVKILKKHDKHLPNPCRGFYTARLNEQKWVQGDYSDVMVSMSRIYSKLRKDRVVEEMENAKQDFVRSTRKYWVHNEDISFVKFAILQHLPIFLQNGMSGESDAQLTSSVYLDNDAMDLYHGRLEKFPGAIALRFRWYGTKPADTVYVERKTHREKWAGKMSVKERFTVKEPQVMSLLKGNFDIEAEVARLQAKGKKESDIDDYRLLATEIAQAIQSRHLYSTMRTQYMRTAFQIPFDPSVRISIDTNLTMISDRTPETIRRERWYRKAGKKGIPSKDITRFPHAVLEIKLQLQDEADTPSWVTELIHSGKLMEVHKFSKFIHGCAVLLSDSVPAMPYWIDDVTLADSIIRSGAEQVIVDADKRQDNPLLPHNSQGIAKVTLEAMLRGATGITTNDTIKRYVFSSAFTAVTQMTSGKSGKQVKVSTPATLQSSTLNFSYFNSSSASNRLSVELAQNAHSTNASRQSFLEIDLGGARAGSSRDKVSRPRQELCNCCEMLVSACPFTQPCLASNICSWADPVNSIKQLSLQKVEPKTFFANERTFITWLNMAVFMSSMSIAVMAFANNSSSSLTFPFLLLPLSLLFIGYALNTYLVRGRKISARDAER